MDTILTEEKRMQIAERFASDGQPVRIGPYGTGHVNDTFLVETETGNRYILQRISALLTTDAEGLMHSTISRRSPNIFASGSPIPEA